MDNYLSPLISFNPHCTLIVLILLFAMHALYHYHQWDRKLKWDFLFFYYHNHHLSFQITIDFLGRLFCFTWNKKNRKKKFVKKANSLLDEEDGPKCVNSEQNGPTNTWTSFSDNMHMTSLNIDPNKTSSDYSCKLRILERNCHSITRQLGEVRNILETIMQTGAQKDTEAAELKHCVTEWKLVAKCLDRLFFLIYLLSIILSLIFLFPRPPGWKNTWPCSKRKSNLYRLCYNDSSTAMTVQTKVIKLFLHL